LLDDNNTGGMDPVLMALDAHPSIEVRVFNPLMHRQARVLDYLSDFSRTNRRMHNKSFTVDNQATVVGGRNVGNEYFGAGDGVMFADLDVMAFGAVVGAVSNDFDRYWSSASTYPLSSIVTDNAERTDIGTTPASDEATQSYLKALAHSDLVQRLRSGNLLLEWAATRLVSDDPAKGLGQAAPAQTLLGQLNQVMEGAKKELTIVSPYFVPTQKGTEHLAGLARSGVPVTILTNALSATDVAAVHAGYAKYRKDLLRAGVRLYELKPSATVMATGHGGLTGSSGASLHAKTFEVDGRHLFVGSFNMDPRSAALNTEMGLLIDSPELAQRLPTAVASHGTATSYAVTLDGDDLRWTTQEGGQRVTFEQEPNASWLRRASVRVLSWLPIEWML
jgi:putative cardiolipin synthase